MGKSDSKPSKTEVMKAKQEAKSKAKEALEKEKANKTTKQQKKTQKTLQETLKKPTVTINLTTTNDDNSNKRDPPDRAKQPAKPNLKGAPQEPKSPPKKKQNTNKDDVTMYDSEGNVLNADQNPPTEIPPTPQTTTIAEVAKKGVKGFDKDGKLLAALFQPKTSHGKWDATEHIGIIEGSVKVAPRPADSNDTMLQHIRYQLWDFYTNQQCDVDPELVLLQLIQNFPDERDRILKLSDIPANLAGMRTIFGKTFRSDPKDGKVRVCMRVGAGDDLQSLCRDIRDNSGGTVQIYPNKLNRPNTTQPYWLAIAHRNTDQSLLASNMNHYFKLVNDGTIKLENYVPAPSEKPLEIALTRRPTYRGGPAKSSKKKKKEEEEEKPEQIYSIHIICEMQDRERAGILSTAFLNSPIYKSVNSLSVCVLPVYDSNSSAAQKDKFSEWIVIHEKANEKIDFRTAQGAILDCDRQNAKGQTLRQLAMSMKRKKNDQTMLFGDVNMTEQGQVLISFSTTFKNEASFTASHLAAYLYHMYQEDGLFWFDEQTKAKVIRQGWNDEEDCPNTAADDIYASLAEEKDKIKLLFDLSDMEKDPKANGVQRPGKELIEDDAATEAEGFSLGGVSAAYDNQGVPINAEARRQYGHDAGQDQGSQEDEASVTSEKSKNSVAYRKQIRNIRAQAAEELEAMREANRKEMEQLRQELAESRLAQGNGEGGSDKAPNAVT